MEKGKLCGVLRAHLDGKWCRRPCDGPQPPRYGAVDTVRTDYLLERVDAIVCDETGSKFSLTRAKKVYFSR